MDYKETKLKTGSPMPQKPVSKRTDGPAKGTAGMYSPAGAAKHLKGQDGCAPDNSGPMMTKQ